MNLKERFIANLDRLRIYGEEPVLVAVSGGVDSMVLLHLCIEAGLKPVVAHANFKLRDEESDSDECFVKESCAELKIPFYSKEFSLKDKASGIQDSARKLRYHWFSSLMQQENLRFILTAHHLDDRIETFFINFMRGVGLKGLKSIPERNIRTYRPLFPFRKEELIEYAKRKKIAWREDASNQKDDYLRNRIRHHVTPNLEKLGKGSIELAGRSLEFLAEADTYFKRAAGKFISNLDSNGFICKICDSDWDSLFDHPPLQKYVFEEFGFEVGQLAQLENLKSKYSGKQVIGKRFTAYRDRGMYILKDNTCEKHKAQLLKNSHEGSIQAPVSLIWKSKELPSEFRGDHNEAWLNVDKLNFPLTLRVWQDGDRFVPLGMKGSKKVSDFLVDIKMSVPEKERTFVLTSNDEICWLVGHRIDDRFKADANTKEALHFRLK
ncbi:MAG: tRNA lysidine(34) synthetase TilS [Flavobacteriales bacterium]|nr:tRNA lysidine(34) synthetase TilS [Flavobacteriales bacterium]